MALNLSKGELFPVAPEASSRDAVSGTKDVHNVLPGEQTYRVTICLDLSLCLF